MKKRLLSLLGAAFVALGINAQWVEPEAPTTGSEVISGHQYRIKNVGASQQNEADMFLAGGVAWFSWSTSTVLVEGAESALTFTLTETESGWTLQRTTDNKYTFVSGQLSGKDCAGWGEMHVDQGSQAAELHFFNIKKNENNGYYRIQFATESNEWYYPDTYWGWELGDEPICASAVYATVSDEEKFAMDWEFIDYSIYNARVALYELLNSTVDNSYVDSSEASKVYQNASATYEELQTALADLKAAIKAARTKELLDGASLTDPRNGTELIENNDFSAGNINGWTCTFVSGTTAKNIGYQKASYTGKEWNDEETGESGTATLNQFIEAWSNNVDAYKFNGRSYATVGDGKLCQTIYGLPAGKYKLSADVNAVQQYESSANPVTGVQLYVIGGDIDSHMDMATDNGKPEHFILSFIHSGGDVELGLRTDNSTANWIAADNFKLMYYGEITENAYKVLLDDAIATYEKQFGDEIYAQASIVAAYEEALAAAKSASGDEQAYIDAKDALDAAAANLKASIAVYQTLNNEIESANEKVDEFAGGDWDDLSGALSDLSSEWVNGYENGSYDAEQIAAIVGQVDAFVAKYVTDNMKPGDDVTLLLKNPAFTSNFSGWTITGATPDWQLNHGNGQNANADQCNEAPAENDGLAEKWHAVFTMSQTIKNLPKGLYTLSVQGFNRADAAGNPAALYAILPDSTEQSVPFADINKYATETQLFDNSATEVEDNWWRSDKENEEGLWIPNSMTGAAWHFMNKLDGENYDYTNKFNILLKEQGDLTVGARCDNASQWVIFDNFRLIYKGTDAGVYTEPILELIASAETYTSKVTEPMIQEIDAAIVAGQDALENGSEEVCEAAILKLQEVINKAAENIKLQSEVVDYLYNTYQVEYDEKCDYLEGDYAEYAKRAEEIMDCVDNEDAIAALSNEELATLKADAEKIVAIMAEAKVAYEAQEKYEELCGLVESATDNSPEDLTDYLVNPDLEAEGSTRGQDPEGWTLDLTQYTNRGYQNNKVYTGEVIELNGEEYTPQCSNFIEVWKSGGEAILGDIYQKIMLPKGTYKLGADVITTNGDAIDGCYLYAGTSHMTVKSDAANTPKHYELIFKVQEDRTVVQLGINCSATCNASWLGADNFTLTAYGANSAQEGNGEENAIESISAQAQKSIFTLTGVRMDKATKPGLYIINGNKVLVK